MKIADLRALCPTYPPKFTGNVFDNLLAILGIQTEEPPTNRRNTNKIVRCGINELNDVPRLGQLPRFLPDTKLNRNSIRFLK
ncbi:MAG: hypothetical protein L6455_15105 [Kiritimatiellae bacterium]|nr:hypothetical protein [Kiritimatiellia bacterium]